MEEKKDLTGETTHKRRVRYSGTHPKKFSEKYKELNPEKYAGEVEKILSKGKTPAGMHVPIMVEEILEVLNVQPGQIGIDATLGYGGHTTKMLEKLQGSGHIFGLDVDLCESAKTLKRLRERGFDENIFTLKNINFANVDKVCAEKVDFILADLGVSSMQIDNPERGFTFKFDAPLDLRLDQSSGQMAWERMAELNERELIELFETNSDEPYAKEIAKQIMIKKWQGEPIERTKQLYLAVEKALAFLPKNQQKEMVKKSCQRVFQALRIEINSEFEVLQSFLNKLPSVLKSGGVVAILTFHSGEDRLVKKSFKSLKASGVYEEISDGVIRPSGEECFKNSRAHSTKLRWAKLS